MSVPVLNLTMEKLIRDWLAGQTYTYTINFYTGTSKGSDGDEPTRQLPCCVVECSGGNERIKSTGIYDLDFSLSVMHNADDTDREAHETTAAEIYNYCTDTAGLTSFNNTVDAHIYDIFPAQLLSDQDSRNWQSTLTLQMVAQLGNMGA